MLLLISARYIEAWPRGGHEGKPMRQSSFSTADHQTTRSGRSTKHMLAEVKDWYPTSTCDSPAGMRESSDADRTQSTGCTPLVCASLPWYWCRETNSTEENHHEIAGVDKSLAMQELRAEAQANILLSHVFQLQCIVVLDLHPAAGQSRLSRAMCSNWCQKYSAQGLTSIYHP